MTKKEIIKEVSKRCNFSQREVAEMYDALGEVVTEGIMNCKVFRLFGVLLISNKERNARKGKIERKDGNIVYWERDKRIIPKIAFSKKIKDEFK